MAKRVELRLMRSVSIHGDQIVFEKTKRESPPQWAWLQLATSETDTDLAKAAGLFGPPPGATTASISSWRNLRKLARLLLASTMFDTLNMSTLTGSVVSKVMSLAAAEGMTAETDLKPLSEMVTELINAGWVEIATTDPLTVKQAIPSGDVIMQAINELLTAKHLLECKQCKRLFIQKHKRPTSFCGTACRKTHSINNPQHG